MFCIEKGDAMTEFEVEAIFNTICRPGSKVRISTKIGCSEDHIPVRMWKHWTVVKKYDNHVLMISRAGYCESFTKFDIKDMIIKGEIRWRD